MTLNLPAARAGAKAASVAATVWARAIGDGDFRERLEQSSGDQNRLMSGRHL